MHKLLSENNIVQLPLPESAMAPDPRAAQRAEVAQTLARLMAGVESIPVSHDAPDSFHPVMADSARSVAAGHEASLDIQAAAQEHASHLTS